MKNLFTCLSKKSLSNGNGPMMDRQCTGDKPAISGKLFASILFLLLFGIGTNQYRLYEDGVMPSEAIGKMLRSIQTPAVFLGYVEGCKNQMPEEEYNKLCQKIQKHLIQDLKKSNSISWFRELFSPRVLGKVAL